MDTSTPNAHNNHRPGAPSHANSLRPRLAESGQALWLQIKSATGGVRTRSFGVLYPTLRVTGGRSFTMKPDGVIETWHPASPDSQRRAATQQEVDELHMRVMHDQVEVARVAQAPHDPLQQLSHVLHSPLGLSFEGYCELRDDSSFGPLLDESPRPH